MIFFYLILAFCVVSEVMYLYVTLPTMSRRFKFMSDGDKMFLGFFFFIATMFGILIQMVVIAFCEMTMKEEE